jgi:hypothetical protein
MLKMGAVTDHPGSGSSSAHVILHMSADAGFCSVAHARSFAELVVAALPQHLTTAVGQHNQQISIVDLAVYHKNQQMRVMHCVKHGDNRVLRASALGKSSPTFEDSLLCVAASHIGASEVAAHASTAVHEVMLHRSRVSSSPEYKCDANAVLPDLCAMLSATLQCRMTFVMLHCSQLHSCASLFVHTTSTTCGHRQHNHNHAVVEVHCTTHAWRLLCRSSCPPGDWHIFMPNLLVASSSAPAWLQQHLLQHSCQL